MFHSAGVQVVPVVHVNPCLKNRVLSAYEVVASMVERAPVLGSTLRYQRPNSSVFLELSASAVFLFMRVQNTGYTNFIGGSSVAFTQTSGALGVAAEQDIFSILPSLTVRCGIRL